MSGLFWIAIWMALVIGVSKAIKTTQKTKPRRRYNSPSRPRIPDSRSNPAERSGVKNKQPSYWQRATSKERLGKKWMPVTKNEQPMYWRLVEGLPEYVVLAQVAFSALLYAQSWRTRNQFNTKVADFVICTRAFEVIAIIELDDSSHRDEEAKARDAHRDAMLEEAGYRVLRYTRVPDREKIRNDVIRPPVVSKGLPDL